MPTYISDTAKSAIFLPLLFFMLPLFLSSPILSVDISSLRINRNSVCATVLAGIVSEAIVHKSYPKFAQIKAAPLTIAGLTAFNAVLFAFHEKKDNMFFCLLPMITVFIAALTMPFKEKTLLERTGKRLKMTMLLGLAPSLCGLITQEFVRTLFRDIL